MPIHVYYFLNLKKKMLLLIPLCKNILSDFGVTNIFFFFNADGLEREFFEINRLKRQI